MKKTFDVIIVGAGHAGLEAAFAAAHLNYRVCLVTLNEKAIALAPCNPSIGGPAKGIVTREIDALGGMQAKATDACQLQMKLLNMSKGAGVRALRAQIDKVKYHEWFVKQIKKQKNITLLIDEVKQLIVNKHSVVGVECIKIGIIKAKKVIITAGTYLNACVHIGNTKHNEGPQHLERSNWLSSQLKKLGFEILRLKTGTPPRILKSSINFKKTQLEPGTNLPLSFSHFNPIYKPYKQQVPCFLTYTNPKTHKIIKDNIHLSAMYSGSINGVGPRYCPSIEDKIIRFANRDRHQVFIEPESLSLDTMYLQGLSTSLPTHVQDQLVHSIRGLEKAKIINYAYAIEYDAINPIQLWPSYESKLYKNLYFAGQINSTSGYEEAACQGLMAGINACLSIKKQKPLILKRHEAYIGVLTDDLVTKGVTEPYRLLTSRAEYRLLLRNDNVLDRLIKYGYQIGLISPKQYQIYRKERKLITQIINYLKHTSTKALAKQYKSAHTLFDLLKRPEIRLHKIINKSLLRKLDNEQINKIEILVKFDGYIKNQATMVDKFNKYENISLVHIKDYKLLKNLSLEAQDKLNTIKPLTLGQAQRISGINLTDLMVIKYYLDNK